MCIRIMAVAMGWYVTGPLALKLRATDPSLRHPELNKEIGI